MTPNADNTPSLIRVVSLSSAHGRRSRMLSRLQRQQLNHEIVDAFDRDDPNVQGYRDPDQDTPQSRGVAACLASHLLALHRFVTSNDTEAIIAEDDVVLAKNFAERFTRLRANIPDDCPLVCLSYLIWHWVGYSWAGKDPSLENLCTMGPDTWGAQMYWIQKSWAVECLRRLDRPFAAIETLQTYRTSETITRDAATRGGLIAYPPLALEDLTGSLILPEAGVANHPEALVGWNRADYDFDKSAS